MRVSWQRDDEAWPEPVCELAAAGRDDSFRDGGFASFVVGAVFPFSFLLGATLEGIARKW